MPIDVVRCIMVRDSSIDFRKKKLINPGAVEELIKTLHLDESPQEQLWVICVDNKSKPSCVAMISQGSSTESVIDLKAIGRYAIMSNAQAIILVHNHPSGVTEPSPEDINSTRRTIQAMQILGIQVIDHVIVGENEMFSFANHKII